MKSIDKIICQEINPFDRESLVPGNFWEEQQEAAFAVNSIHEQEIKQIEVILNSVQKDALSRTILLTGDSGSGKSYLLGRLKRNLNDRAFFAYIGPWPDSKYMWRHTLRQTVDSLVCKPEGQQESQLLLWLKGLSAFRSQGLAKKILGERGLFIKNLRDTYPTGIYNAKQFFGVLYDLTNPDLYNLACDWLRGDDLSEEDLKKLKVKKSIDSEEAAQGIVGNFGKISVDNRPIVLCFDQLDSLPKENGFINFQPLFTLNSTIHNKKYTFRNYLVIISVITTTWQENKQSIQLADLAEGRINKSIRLKLINMKQAEALWQMRLHHIHEQANPKHHSKLYPLCQQQLKINFPGGKTHPRDVLLVGSKLYQTVKAGICKIIGPEPPIDLITKFKLLWQDKHQKSQQKIKNMTILNATELIKMLQVALTSFKISQIQPRLIPGKYDIYSFSYLHPKTKARIGIVWNEDPNGTTFYHVMNASQKVVTQKKSQKLYLIRWNHLGSSQSKGNQLYQKIFFNTSNHHIKPNVSSVQYLNTCFELFKLAQARELIIGEKNISIEKLQDLIRKSGVLNECQVLRDLGIIDRQLESDSEQKADLKQINPKVKEYLLNLVKTNQMLAKGTLMGQVKTNFSDVTEAQIEKSIQDLDREKKIKLINAQDNSKAQLICFVPQGNAA